jgi:hypothetical protein
MKYRPLRLSAVALLTLTAATALADEAPQFRDPGDMTVEERSAIMQRVNDYNGCVFRESMARVDALPDIRQAADEGLEACKATLDAVRETILGFGFEAAFAEQFARHSQNRAVHRLIPELSLRKGGR